MLELFFNPYCFTYGQKFECLLFNLRKKVLAEAGVIPSKLSWNNSFNYSGSDSLENKHFFPDRYICILYFYAARSNFVLLNLICALQIHLTTRSNRLESSVGV